MPQGHLSSFFLTPREIGIALRNDGFVATSPNFATTIYTTCRRKVKSGKLIISKKKGFKAFRYAAILLQTLVCLSVAWKK